MKFIILSNSASSKACNAYNMSGKLFTDNDIFCIVPFLSLSIYIYIYIYILCVCVCVLTITKHHYKSPPPGPAPHQGWTHSGGQGGPSPTSPKRKKGEKMGPLA